MAKLRHLASTCDFGRFLYQALRDRLVCGLRNAATQKRLLVEADLTLNRAVEGKIATAAMSNMSHRSARSSKQNVSNARSRDT